MPKGKCSRCGKGSHSRQQCPARDAICHKCRKKGHYSSQCFSKSIADVTLGPILHSPEGAKDSDYYDTAYLDAVGTGQSSKWTTTISIAGAEVIFKLDTGAEVTTISETTFKSLKLGKLETADKVLCGPDRKPLGVLGRVSCTLAHKGKKCQQSLYVLKHLRHNLLGLPAIQGLQLLTQADSVSTKSIPDQFPTLFQGLGTFQEEYEIKLKPDATPFALYTPRNVPLPLRKKVELEIQRMEALGVIAKVDEPTPWCAGMVVVPKKSGDVRICVDFRPLNESVLREVHPLPKVEETLAKLTGATVFSKLDANSGFWQIPLSKECQHLTTFITPFGRYCFHKLPFGISSAPEHFQKQMSRILEREEGTVCHIDDVLVFGRTQQEHDLRLHSVLQKIAAAGVTLNEAKCEFNKQCITFLGHVIDSNGISQDPEKTEAITKMKQPQTTTELRRFLGMVNQLSRFTPNIAEISQPLRELLSTKRAWMWGPAQEEAFVKLKEELTSPSVLMVYDPEAPTKVSADASMYGIGAVLLQETPGPAKTWRPVSYASRAMSQTERRYAQIEKEALAVTWACERFAAFILGKKIMIETDHKPLVPILNKKDLDTLPPRVLRFRLRLARFDYLASHTPGKLLYTADALSRAPHTEANSLDVEEADKTESFVNYIRSSLPAHSHTLEAYKHSQQSDVVCAKLISYCKTGWPDRRKLDSSILRFWPERNNLSLSDDLLLHGRRIVVPSALRKKTLEKVHRGHQGIQRCRLKIVSSVWWPGVAKEMEELVRNCTHCTKITPPPKEPMIASQLPQHPWEKVGSDLFEFRGSQYLLVVDYFSRYIEVQKLNSTTSSSIIASMKAMFSRHGIPSILMSDNGPQYVSQEMKDFAAAYGFCHLTSSPHYPQSNGLAERSVKTMKSILCQTDDQYLALLTFRTTPMPWCGFSPAELLMGRKLRTDIPQVSDDLIPQWTFLDTFREKDAELKTKEKQQYDRRHRVRPQDPLPDNQEVWVRTGDRQVPGRILRNAGPPRSYIVETPSGQVRRNRAHLTLNRDGNDNDDSLQEAQRGATTSNDLDCPSRNTRSRTGTVIAPPNRLTYRRKGDVA